MAKVYAFQHSCFHHINAKEATKIRQLYNRKSRYTITELRKEAKNALKRPPRLPSLALDQDSTPIA